MTVEFSSIVNMPRQDVFTWYQRQGAIRRLTPPWHPVNVASEAEVLDGGTAVLALPAGLRWVARHSGYEPPRRFVDELTSLPLPWRHTHTFVPAGEHATRVIDTIETPLPAFALNSMFQYRYRQLANDLATHSWAARYSAPLTVAVTGGSGLVGSALSALLGGGGHQVVRLVRHAPREPDERQWQPDDPDPDLLDGVDAVVHLAGASIAGRFTERHNRRIRNSRVEPTRRLAELAARSDTVRCFVTASAIGYYGSDRGDEILTESSPRGDGFLADVVDEWEAATRPARDAGIRVTQIRTGIVQSPRGGPLRLLYPLFAAGLGGRLGSGRQWLSWIGLDDLVDVYYRALVDSSVSGPVNAVAPHPLRNSTYTRTLATVLHRPALLPIPELGPRALLGSQGSGELAEANQRVLPQRLQELGHGFRHPELESTLRHVLGRTNSPTSTDPFAEHEVSP